MPVVEAREAVNGKSDYSLGEAGLRGVRWDFEVWMCSTRTVGSSLQLFSRSTILLPGTECSVVSLTPRGAAFGGGQLEWNLI